MNENIIEFMQLQTCATICCMDQDRIPYCFTVFYVFSKENYGLYFKSSKDSHHAVLLSKNPIVAGTILPDKLNKLILKGIQFKGEVLDEFHPMAKDSASQYYSSFPAARLLYGFIYTLKLNDIKMTDSSMIFGKKRIWKRDENTIRSQRL